MDSHFLFYFFQKISDGDAFEEIIDHFVQLVPHGLGLAAFRPGTGSGTLTGAGYGAEASFRQLQDAAHRLFFRGPVQAIAAAFSVDCVHETGLGQSGHDGFQILLGDSFCFRDLL